MNENANTIQLLDIMKKPEGWGREQGRLIYQRLIDVVEENPGVLVFRVVLTGVERVDASFASETIVEIARRYRGNRGFCFVDMPSQNQADNWDAAAVRKEQPILLWQGPREYTVLGQSPSPGLQPPFQYAMERESVRAADFAAHTGGNIVSVSSKFKQLWQQGFLLRLEAVRESGGIEFIYYRIK